MAVSLLPQAAHLIVVAAQESIEAASVRYTIMRRSLLVCSPEVAPSPAPFANPSKPAGCVECASP